MQGRRYEGRQLMRNLGTLRDQIVVHPSVSLGLYLVCIQYAWRLLSSRSHSLASDPCSVKRLWILGSRLSLHYYIASGSWSVDGCLNLRWMRSVQVNASQYHCPFLTSGRICFATKEVTMQAAVCFLRLQLWFPMASLYHTTRWRYEVCGE